MPRNCDKSAIEFHWMNSVAARLILPKHTEMADGRENTSSIVEKELDTHLKDLQDHLEMDVIYFSGSMQFGLDNLVREHVEEIQNKRPGVLVILETGGGYSDVAERIADTLRHHYLRVEYLVPNYAMSAGTILVMSGDAIYMDYYSVLGPIDPQVQNEKGVMVPAHGYLVQYNKLIEKSKKGEITTAELNFLIEKFDPAELHRYEQEMNLSVTLLKDWLANYKFKDWKKDGQSAEEAKKMREERATEIAKLLNNTEQWHSHSRGISMKVLREKAQLKIEDFGENLELNRRVRAYYELIKDYADRTQALQVVHSYGNYHAR